MGVWVGVALLTAVAQVAAEDSVSTYVSRGAAARPLGDCPGSEHQVTADDGYITTVFRLPLTNNSAVDGQPVLLQHGLFSSCQTWFQIGVNSLPYMLARRGYDVWVTNARGNSYSTLHKTLDPLIHRKRYWNFSFHEMAVKDLPATIDYILEHTKKDKLSYIGHSLGGAMDFTLLSEVPRYNDKINVAVSLAPAVYNYEYTPQKIMELFEEFLYKWGFKTLSFLVWAFRWFVETVIQIEWPRLGISLSYPYIKLSYLKRSEDIDEFMAQTLRTLDYFLEKTEQKSDVQRGSGWDFTSVKNLQHIFQTCYFGRFQKFSYGESWNKELYGSSKPPLYKLRNVKTQHVIMYSDLDWLTPPKLVQRLCRDLPKNVGSCMQVQKSNFSHGDFTASRHAKVFVNDEVVRVLGDHLPVPPTTTPPTTTPVNNECIV